MMLKVATIIKKSTIEGAGLGLFTAEDIKKGQIVWEWDDSNLVIEDAFLQSQNFPEGIRNIVTKYAELHQGNWYLYIENSSFLNHSIEPNLDIINGFFSDMIATRDISAGEELFVNYHNLDEDALRKLSGVDIK